MLNGPITPIGKPIIDRFLDICDCLQDKIAITSDTDEVTYTELRDLVWTYSHVIRQADKTFEAVILYLPRNVNLVAAMLACQYCQVCYTPVDMGISESHLKKILSSCRYQIIYDSEHKTNCHAIDNGFDKVDIRGFISPGIHKPVIRPDRPLPQHRRQSEVYRIYTSGSTGAPKAVMVPELACANLVDHFSRLLEIAPGHRWLSSTSVSFDIFFLEYTMPLIHGATLVLLSDTQTKSPQLIAEALCRWRPHIYQATPSVFKCLFPYLPEYIRFDKLMVGGEALGEHLCDQLQQHADWVCNVYGPTETTVWSTFMVLDSPGERRIGQPISNTQICILDQNLEPLPPQVSGRIFIGGDGVTLGYFNNLDLTAQKFIIREVEGEMLHLYDTGDIGFIDQQGILNYERREGDFYKINGNRVDPAEIVDALECMDEVLEAAVVVTQLDDSSENILVAFLRTDCQSKTVAHADVRDYLGQRLPSYMLPAYTRIVNEFKYSDSGKLDKKALLKVFSESQLQDRVPENQSDDPILAAVSKYVSIEGLKDNENLFNRGLTSMQAVSLHIDLSEHCSGFELYHIFDNPTVEGFKEYLLDIN